jgi:hypothetical protein
LYIDSPVPGNISKLAEHLPRDGTTHKEGFGRLDIASVCQIFGPHIVKSGNHELDKCTRALKQYLAKLSTHGVSHGKIGQNLIMDGPGIPINSESGVYTSRYTIRVAEPVLIHFCAAKEESVFFNSNSKDSPPRIPGRKVLKLE